MKTFYLFIRNILLSGQTRTTAGVAMTFFAALWLPDMLFAQAPAISYSTPQTFVAGTAITALTPVNTGSAVPSFGYNSPTLVNTGVTDPVCMVMDNSGNIYIGESSGKVVVLAPGSSSATVLATGFGPVNELALDAANNVYLADGTHVWKIPAGGGIPVTIGSFTDPVSVTVEADGDLFVGNKAYADGLFHVSPTGDILHEMGTSSPPGIGSPTNVLIDGAGDMVVADNNFGGLLVGYPATEYSAFAGGGVQVYRYGLAGITFLAIDPAGNIFMSDNAGIQRFSPGNSSLVTITSTAAEGLMTDANFNLYYADGHNIYKMTPNGYFTTSLPPGLSLDASSGAISGTPTNVAPAADYTVRAFNATGNSSTTINITVNPALPELSYSSPQSYQVGTAISALSPSSSNVSSWSYSNATAIGTFFQAPTDVVADAAGNIYVAEFGKGQVNKIPAGGGAVTVVTSGLSGPFGLAIDASGNLYITDSGNNAVREIPAGTSTVNTIGSNFNAPAALAVDGSGNVYVGDTGNGALKEIPAGNGTPVTLQTGFASIQGLTVDAAGNIYVADAGVGASGNGAVYKIPAGGGSKVSLGTGFSRPSGIVVDAAGNLYVSDLNNTFITIIKPDGTQFSIGSGVVRVNGVALDTSGNLYMADTGTGFVEDVKINGGYFLSPLLPAGLTFNNSTGVISGTPSVSSPAANYTITGWNVTGNAAATVSITVGTPIISYTSPVACATGVAITPLTPMVSGGAVASPVFSPAVTVSTGISDATCLTMDKAGNLYIGESSGMVSKLAPGAATATVYATGFATVDVLATEGIAADASGNVYFADGTSLWKIPTGGGAATTLGSFTAAQAMALDAAGNIYVGGASAGGPGIFKMQPDGSGQTKISSLNAQGVTIDPNGNLFAYDNLSTLYEIPAGGVQKNLRGFNEPLAITADASGNIYVADYAGNTGINVLCPDGSVHTAAAPDFGATGMFGLFVDPNYNIYVASGTVTRLKPTGGYFISPELPNGLFINAATGIISGTPATASPTNNYTIKAYNTAASATATVNITVGTAPAISYSTPQVFTVGTTISALLPASTGAAIGAPAFNSTIVPVGAGITDATCTAIDKNGNLYFGQLSGQISVLAPGSATATLFATGFRVFGSGSVTHEGIAFDASGNVYFVDGSSLWKIPAGGGSPVRLNSSDAPEQVAIDAAGNLYFSDFAQGVFKMNTDGTHKTAISNVPGIAMAVDQNGNIFFSSRGSLNKLMEIPAGGTLKTVNPNPVRTCATDPAGNVYMVNNDLSITMISADGTTTTQVEPAIAGLTSIMIGPDLNLYAVVNGVIMKTNFSGGYFINPELPLGLNISPTTGTISGTPTAVSAATNYTITAFSGSVSGTASVNITVTGQPPVISYATPKTYSIGLPISPSLPTNTGGTVPALSFSSTPVLFSNAVTDAIGLCTAADGSIYAGGADGTISVLAPGSSSPTVFATGFGPVYTIAFDASNNVFAVDGAHVWKIPAGGGTAVSLGDFDSPVSVAFDAAGNIYVGDNSVTRPGVYKMHSDGTGQTRIDNNLIKPAYIAFDKNGNLYIGDQVAQALYEIPAGGTQTQLATGVGLVVSLKTDASGNVYVASHGSPDQIYCYSPGKGITNVGSFNTFGLTTDADYNLYYAWGYLYKLTPTGGYFTSPQLPAGLTIDPTSGAISGTPTALSAATNYTVTAFNFGASGTATANIRVTPVTANLSALILSAGIKKPGFSPGVTAYTASVANSMSSVTVTPVAADPNAVITVNGNTVASGSASGQVALTAGAPTTITVVVTAEDHTTKTYTVTVTRGLPGDAALASIGPQYGPLTPVFYPTITSYTKFVPNDKSTMTVTPVAHDPLATITVNGTPVASGATSAPVALPEGGATAINVVVTAQDGTTKTYTIEVFRAPSPNADLSSMGPQYGPLTPFFVSGTTDYTLNVPYSKATMTVTPVPADPNATITVNGDAVTPGSTSSPVALVSGATTTITVVVTAQNHNTTKTYTVAVTRALPDDALLAAIGPQYGPLSPVFYPTVTSYTLNLSNSKSTITVTPMADDPLATITVNGTAVAPGSTSVPVALTAGEATSITVVVTAQDGTTTKTYTITVNRAPGASDSFQDISVSKPMETVTLAEDGIKVHQGISPNGDGIDDVLQIDNISQYPDNHLKIMNRNGQLVFEASGYDNASKVFDGRSNKNGQMQLPGTYFFQLDYTVSGTLKHKTGFIVLKY